MGDRVVNNAPKHESCQFFAPFSTPPPLLEYIQTHTFLSSSKRTHDCVFSQRFDVGLEGVFTFSGRHLMLRNADICVEEWLKLSTNRTCLRE